MLKIGDPAPTFSRPAHSGVEVNTSSYVGKQILVLYFYPMDQTPGCTTQACGFRDAYADFAAAGAVVIGVSGDSLESHARFARDRQLPFLLLSDSDGSLRQLFQVPKTWGLFPGRVTFVIDQSGVIRHIFNSQFNAKQHISEALHIVRELANS